MARHRCHYWPPRTHYCCHHRSSAIFIPQPSPLMGTFIATKCQKIIFLVTIILQKTNIFSKNILYWKTFYAETNYGLSSLVLLPSIIFAIYLKVVFFFFFFHKQGCLDLFKYVTILYGHSTHTKLLLRGVLVVFFLKTI